MNESDRLVILLNETSRIHKVLVEHWCNGNDSDKLMRIIEKLNKRWHRIHKKILGLSEDATS